MALQTKQDHLTMNGIEVRVETSQQGIPDLSWEGADSRCSKGENKVKALPFRGLWLPLCH